MLASARMPLPGDFPEDRVQVNNCNKNATCNKTKLVLFLGVDLRPGGPLAPSLHKGIVGRAKLLGIM